VADVELTEIVAGEVAQSPRRRPALATVEHVLGMLVEIPAALLVAAEIVILFAGVVARYGLHSPLIWSDELASILFLWLAMLGAAVAFRRAEHMRMTAIVAGARPSMRAYLDLVATCAALAFLLMMAWPAYDYAYEESFITTPALQILNSWRAAALPVGIGLMALFALLRLARAADFRTVLGAILSVAVVIAVFWFLKGWLKPLGNINLVIFFVGVAGFCVFAGIPIAFGFGLATYGYLALTTNTPLMVLVGRMDEGMSHLILLAVPLFVFLGLLIEMTGMARAMVAFLASLLGHVRGGLHYVLVGAMYLVSGISGSKAADMAAVAPVLFPEMKLRGAKPGDLVALLAATGAQTETIPPSLVLITIGSVTGVSIAALFTGGLLPGVVLAMTLCTLVWWRYRDDDLRHVSRASGREIARALVIALPALALPFVIRYAVVEGIATATEVSTIGIVYGVVIGLLVYRRFDWRRLMPMLSETACLSGAILLIIGTATAMAWGLTQSGFSRALATAMTGLPGAMIIILAMGIGLFAPPFGVGYYAACAIGRVDPAEGIRPIWGYLLALLVGLIVVAIFPWISIGFL
jgi:tripartite ATP-independent transporter DctM subunit